MGSSKKKSAAKRADFQKPKFKVGKSRPQNSNVTNTSFATKGIVVKDQSLSTELPSLDDRVSTHFAHLGSRSESQRKESLAALANVVARSRSAVSTQSVLERALPLITDGSLGVREGLLGLLRSLPREQCRGFEDRVVLYLQTGLTHIAGGVRRSALEFLGWASETYGEGLVSCHGGWYKTLRCFLLLLSWKQDATAAAAAATGKEWAGSGQAIENLNKEPKLMVKVLETFAAFIRLGLSAQESKDEYANVYFLGSRPHQIPTFPRPFARLGLFEAPKDPENQLYSDVPSRKALFDNEFRDTVARGVLVAKRQGGELGRAAGLLNKAINDSSS